MILEDYNFHEGVLPSEYQPDFNISVFNQPKHLQLQASEGWHMYAILNKKYKTVEGIFYVHIKNGEGNSPLRSPFGSIECSLQTPPIILYQFLEFIEARLRALDVWRVVIKNPPQKYFPKQAALLETFLFNQGYRVVDAEVSTIIPMEEDFTKNLAEWEKRKLRQSQNAQFQFRQISGDHLNDTYLFILACRKQKGYTLSITLPDLRKTAEHFPDHYLLFAVYHEEKLVAASISIKVQPHILYNFSSAHDKAYDAFSPVVLLLEGMCKYSAMNEILFVDLGTSAVELKPNFSLLDFKMRLGGEPSSKLTFAKDFI